MKLYLEDLLILELLLEYYIFSDEETYCCEEPYSSSI